MTVKELARLAGVSPATVSLVLNKKKGVSEEKRKLVLQVIEENQYRHQRKGDVRNRNILFIKYSKHGKIVEENAGFISALMDGAELECKQSDYNFILKKYEGDFVEILKGIRYQDFCGVLVLGTEIEESDYEALETIPVPYVVVDNSMPHFDCNSVAIDNRENAFKAVRYFATHGFKRVGYFKGNAEVQNFTERKQGFYDAVKRYGLEVDEHSIFPVPPTMLGAFEFTQRYAEEREQIPPAIFVDNDTMAIGVIKALKIADFDIPGDVSVIGFDDIPFAQIYSPSISTMRVDKNMLGKIAMSTLQNSIEKEDFRNVKIKIGGDLIIRQSTK